MRFLTILLVLAAVIAAGVVEWGNAAWDAAGPPAPYGKETVIFIPAHSRTHDIAQMLEKQGVMKHGLLFELDVRMKGLAPQLKAGEYAIPGGASMKQIAELLVSGKSIQHKLTAAEGLTSNMIWKLVRNDKALTGDAGPEPQEGTLLPETYLFTRGETRAHMLARMRSAQEKFLLAQWSGRKDGLPIKTMREAVILASLVEKETSLAEERRHIASVFLNRLKVGMKLQTDPTIIYGITRGYPLGRGIRQSEIEAATPYNTYAIGGLPPGPICNPGKDSIAAVLNPEDTDDLFFVASGSGGHVFASTMSAHQRNVAAWRALERHTDQPERQIAESPGIAEPPIALPPGATPKLSRPARARTRRARH